MSFVVLKLARTWSFSVIPNTLIVCSQVFRSAIFEFAGQLFPTPKSHQYVSLIRARAENLEQLEGESVIERLRQAVVIRQLRCSMGSLVCRVVWHLLSLRHTRIRHLKFKRNGFVFRLAP